MKTVARLTIAGAFVFGLGQIGHAQMQMNPPPAGGTAPAAPAAPKAAPMSAAEMKAKAKECSAKATEKGLHGKARKEFREKCKRGEEE
jgi:psiF repeat